MKVVVIDPLSSGRCLVTALEDEGCQVTRVYGGNLSMEGNSSYRHECYEHTLAYVASRQPMAILAGSEYGVALAERLASDLHLPTNDISCQHARLNKAAMYERLALQGVNVEKSYLANDESQLVAIMEDHGIGFPVFVKPKASAGSDGCSTCTTMAELTRAFRNIFAATNLLGKRNDGVLIQRYIQGEQFVVNTVSVDALHLISEVYRVKLDEIGGVPVYRSMVACEIGSLNPKILAMTDYTRQCLDALGIRNGAAHTELRMTVDGPVLIEVNSRMMGPVLDANAFYHGYGYSQATLLAEACLHREKFMARFSQPRKLKKHFAIVFLRNTTAGTVIDRKGLEVLRRLPGFHSVVGAPAIGATVSNPLLTTGSFGIAYFAHEDSALLDHSLAVLHALEDEHGIYGMESRDLARETVR